MNPGQARSSDFHPYMIDTLDALPAKLREAAAAALLPGEPMVRAFVVPNDYRSPDGFEAPRVVPMQALIFTSGNLVHVQAGTQDAPAPPPIYVQPETVLWIRSSHVLLYGKLELVSAIRGEASKLEMQFNAVGWRLMQPEWHALVCRAIGVTAPLVEAQAAAPPEEGEEEPYTLDEETMRLVASVPDKFVDGLGRYGLYTGEKLLGVVFQPALWKENLIAFDEQLLPNTLVALTNASVLIMAEESALVRKSEQFGLIITRIPRRAIAGMEVTETDPLPVVGFTLRREGVTDEVSVALGAEAAAAWQELWGTA